MKLIPDLIGVIWNTSFWEKIGIRTERTHRKF